MPHRRHDHHDHPATDASLADLLDLDAEVLHAYLAGVIAWLGELAGDLPGGRILDLGTGTGGGALALARHFERADVTAVDISADYLGRLRDKATAGGMPDRVHTVEADLDATWPTIDPVDLVWASNSMHHMADPDRVLANVFATIRPGGLLALVEMDSFPRFLPDDLGIGRPELEARCHAAMTDRLAEDVPHLGSDWRARLTAAGFAIAAERQFTIDLTPPLPAATGRYAQASLRRVRTGLDGQLSADDLATLDRLIDGDGPDSILRRDDLTVRAARTVWAAQRP